MFSSLMNFIAEHLIAFMMLLFFASLWVRFVIYWSSKKDLTYFTTFAKEIEKFLNQSDLAAGKRQGQVLFLEKLFDKISERLPQRSLRFAKSFRDKSKKESSAKCHRSNP